MPLTLPPALVVTDGGNAPAIDQLISALPAGLDKGLLAAVINASQEGEQAVADAVASAISAILVIEQEL